MIILRLNSSIPVVSRWGLYRIHWKCSMFDKKELWWVLWRGSVAEVILEVPTLTHREKDPLLPNLPLLLSLLGLSPLFGLEAALGLGCGLDDWIVRLLGHCGLPTGAERGQIPAEDLDHPFLRRVHDGDVSEDVRTWRTCPGIPPTCPSSIWPSFFHSTLHPLTIFFLPPGGRISAVTLLYSAPQKGLRLNSMLAE